MKNNSNFKVAVVVTISATIVYAFYLWFLNHTGQLPVEKEVEIQLLHSKRIVPLPFEVSYWWNLCICPLIISVLAYCYSSDEITGKEPSTDNSNIKDKYAARTTVFCVTAMSLAMMVGPVVLMIILSPFTEESFGPLTAATNFAFYAVIVYIVFGFAGEFLVFFFSSFTDNYDEKRTATEKYQSLATKFIRIGILKTSPMLLGLSVAFMLRLIDTEISKFFKRIKITFSIRKEVKLL